MKIEDVHFDLPTEAVDEENWDLEKWRKEHPMDYLKALQIVNMSDNSEVKAELFKTIYKITRFHIPEVLYKYYSLTSDESLNKKKFDTLNDGQIFMSNIKDFNDPFDGKGFYYNPEQLSDIELLQTCGGRIIEDFNDFIKATSMTANGIQSMPMWAHYSNNHAGFCVSYDMNANKGLKSCTFPVQYTDERLDVTSLMRVQVQKISNEVERQTSKGSKTVVLDDYTIIYMASMLCNLKHSSWSYEQEFRCTTGAIAEGMPYIDAKPKEIYVGMNCEKNHETRLLEIAASWKIPVYKMVFDECSNEYSLVAKKYES